MKTRRILESGLPPEVQADLLKERTYISITALAVVLSMSAHADEMKPATALATLTVTIAGTVLAVFAAAMIANVAVRQRLPTRAETVEEVRVTFGALPVLIVPMAFLVGATLNFWNVGAALTGSVVGLVVALIVVARVAVSRVPLPRWQKRLLLGAEILVGVAVLALERLAHGL